MDDDLKAVVGRLERFAVFWDQDDDAGLEVEDDAHNAGSGGLTSDLRTLLSALRQRDEALEDMRDAWLGRYGCFPIDRYSPETRLRHRAMSRTYEAVGQGTEAGRKAKLAALALEIENERIERRDEAFARAILTGSETNAR